MWTRTTFLSNTVGSEECPPSQDQEQEALADDPALVSHHIVAIQWRHKFLLKLAHALMRYGTPTHEIDDRLTKAAAYLMVNIRVAILNSVIILVFERGDGSLPSTHFVQEPQELHLDLLQRVQMVYDQVLQDDLSAGDGAEALERLLVCNAGAHVWVNLILAFIAGFTICPMGFSGTFAEAIIAGSLCAIVQLLQMLTANNPAFLGIFEMTAAILVSMTARLLNSIHGNIFCYSAISSASAVLILPGFLVFQGSVELASKHLITGSTKLIFSIIYSLILGFSLTFGSDIAFMFLPLFRRQRDAMMRTLTSSYTLTGNYTSLLPQYSGLNGTFQFQQVFESDQPIAQFHYVMDGCYRDPSRSWILQPLDWKFLFILVPTFLLCLAILNGQVWRARRLWVMVAFGCCSFAANKLGEIFIFEGGQVVSALGATIVGILGSVYGHYWQEDPFSVMVPGILVLLPAGLSVVGGLSSNLQDPRMSGLNWLVTGMRMVEVTIGITVGIFASNCIVFTVVALADWLTSHFQKEVVDA